MTNSKKPKKKKVRFNLEDNTVHKIPNRKNKKDFLPLWERIKLFFTRLFSSKKSEKDIKGILKNKQETNETITQLDFINDSLKEKIENHNKEYINNKTKEFNKIPNFKKPKNKSSSKNRQNIKPTGIKIKRKMSL